MADQLQLRGGTTAEHSTFTGALREVTVDTDKDTVVVHDGSTAGGHPLAKQNLSNVPAGTITSTMIADGTIVNADINASAAIDKTKISGTAITAGDTGTVTSTMIADGTIVNADVNASAAIAGTKISPDFGSQTIQTTGVVSHALGTAAAPTLTFTGDTNTGVYSPGADQVAISTNGTGRLFIDSSGRVGVGGTANAARLASFSADVGGSIGDTAQIVSVNTNGGIGDFSGVRFNYYNDGNTGGKFAYIGSVLTSTTSNGAADIVFGTRPTSTTTISERFRITSDGKVGVGTSSPGALLHIVSGDAAQIIENSVAASNASLQLKYPSRTWSIANRGADLSGSLTFRDVTAGADRVVIDSSGRLGVGTTSPGSYGANLAVATAGDTGVSIASGTSSLGGLYFADGTTGTDTYRGYIEYSHTNDFLKIGTAAAERLRIDSSGRVGIGTSSPGGNLTVTDASTYTLNVNANAGGAGALLSTVGGSASLALGTNSTERLRITAAGNVGIGSTSPSTTLSIGSSATGGYNGGVLLNRGASVYNFYEASDGTNTVIFGLDNTLSNAKIGSINSYPIGFYTGNVERARIDTSGRLLVGTSSSRSVAGIESSLQIEGGAYSGATFITNSASGAGSYLSLAKSRGTSGGSTTIVQSGDTLGVVSFSAADGTDLATEAATITAQVDGTPGANDMPGRLVFSTTADGASSPTERMRIDNAGNVMIRTTSSNPNNSNSAFFNIAGYIGVNHINGTGSGTGFAAFNYNAGEIGSITQNGTTAVSYNTTSDYRLKENVIPVTDGIARLQQLKPSRFNFIADPERTVDGFIAHEVQDVIPEAITGEKDAVDDEGNPKYQGIDQSKLVPLLTAALQEAIGEIESLKARLTAAGI